MTTNEVLEIFGQNKPAPAIAEYEREQQAIRSNYERLKAERLEMVDSHSGHGVRLAPTHELSRSPDAWSGRGKGDALGDARMNPNDVWTVSDAGWGGLIGKLHSTITSTIVKDCR